MNNFKSLNKQFIISILFISIFGSMSHFFYDFSGELSFIGALFPVNESVWEHLKLLLIPIISWWILFYYINREKLFIDKDKWFFATLISLLYSMFFQLSIFYIYTSALGVEYLVVDILIFLISVILGQLIGLHIYKYYKGINYKISIFILITLIIFFIFVTFNTPHLPIFCDPITGNYGL